LNWGCIPTKSLLKNAEVLRQIKQSEKYGIKVGEISIDYKKNLKRSRDVSNRLSKGVGYLIKKNKVAHINGIGVLKDQNTISINMGNKNQVIEFEKIIIATGAHPKSFPMADFDGKMIINYKDALELTSIPKKIIIVGSGAVGCEFASYFNEFGAKISLIESMSSVLPNEDIEISKQVLSSFLDSGIEVLTNTDVYKIEKNKNKVKVFVKNQGRQKTIIGDIVLVAIGVEGNIKNIGLKSAGVKTDKCSIEINELNQTNINNIYAVGDVTGPPWLAHVASAQGIVAAEHIAGNSPHPVNYFNIPNCTYCYPEVGSIGLTEQKAIDAGYEIKVGRFFLKANGKNMAIGETGGLIKLIFDSKYGELIGAHVVGSNATELIGELGIAKSLEARWEDLAFQVHAHPTLSESIMEASMDAFSAAIHQ
tara:strand:+ start:3105 stop:4370 length:1266 start_codon:yes stop_codon:yes gene_type:complete